MLVNTLDILLQTKSGGQRHLGNPASRPKIHAENRAQ
jgi:hypothetical protein